MGGEGGTPAPAPTRRKDSWSLRHLVRDVSGLSLEELQEPGREPHPYLRIKPDAAGVPLRTETLPERPAAGIDPVFRVTPPLVGPIGRELHGPTTLHHNETLDRASREAGGLSVGRPTSPLRRPERVYLHYLLLHLDRLSTASLEYLRHSVEEELLHRQ
ncbi:MAG: hypothetical protein ACYDFT_07250, partial [Thermoplasmata archaeon]